MLIFLKRGSHLIAAWAEQTQPVHKCSASRPRGARFDFSPEISLARSLAVRYGRL